MNWGAMSVNETAALYFLPAGVTMNGSRYENLLRAKLQLHMAVHQCSVFMHDGAPCHRSKGVQSFLDQQRINGLEWPGNTPDLNPIENLWLPMKRKVAEQQSSSLLGLQHAIKEVWVKNSDVEYCRKLILSMPKRIRSIIKYKRGHTKY